MTKTVRIITGKSFSIEVIGIIYFTIIVIAGVILVGQPAKIARLNQKAAQLTTQLQDLKLRNENLKRTVASMESLTYIETQARNDLGMKEPDQVRSVAINIEHERSDGSIDQNHLAVEKSSKGIYTWLDRIAEFMKHRIVVAKKRR